MGKSKKKGKALADNVSFEESNKKALSKQKAVARKSAMTAEIEKKKALGLQLLGDSVPAILKEHHLTFDDFLENNNILVLQWIKRVAIEGGSPEGMIDELHEILKLDCSPTKTNENTLKMGRYLNPHSGEEIDKIRRNPKQLDDWIDQYGIETVKTWFQGVFIKARNQKRKAKKTKKTVAKKAEQAADIKDKAIQES